MVELPHGVGSFVFFDMVGSTARCRSIGTANFAVLLERYHGVVRRCFETVGGALVQLEGDGGFGATPSAREALRFGELLSAAAEELGFAVRLGVHTAEAFVTATGYVGEELHRAARIVALSNGGQTLLSEATVAGLGDEVTLVDLGEHRLRSFQGVTRLFQLGAHRHPPLRGTFVESLPAVATSTIGREAELTELGRLLLGNGPRLLTIAGPGGVGKTRTAIEAAARLTDRLENVWWVPLAGIGGSGLVAETIERVLEIVADPARSSVEQICARLNAGRFLLVLDNAEHVLDGVSEVVGAVLRACPDTRVVCTSRVPLRVAGERLFELDVLEQLDGVQLFMARAVEAGVAVDPRDAGIVDGICRRLDCLPLAIELAAARVRLLGVAGLEKRLDRALSTLGTVGTDLTGRRRTMRATIEWSVDLLKPTQAELLARLSVFPAGARLDTLEKAFDVGLDELESLFDHHLVRLTLDPDGTTRFSLLTLIREYASELLEAGDVAETTNHAALGVWAELASTSFPPLYESLDRRFWLTQFAPEWENIRYSLDWASTHDKRAHAEVSSNLVPIWWETRQFPEALRRLELAVPNLSLFLYDAPLRARAAWALSCVQLATGETSESNANAQAAVDAFRQSGDQWWLSIAMFQLANTLTGGGERVFLSALAAAEAAGNVRDQIVCRVHLSYEASRRDDQLAALDHAREARRLAEGGCSVSHALVAYATACGRAGQLSEAVRMWLEILDRIDVEGTESLFLYAWEPVEFLAARGFRDAAATLFRWGQFEEGRTGMRFNFYGDQYPSFVADDNLSIPVSDVALVLQAIRAALQTLENSIADQLIVERTNRLAT